MKAITYENYGSPDVLQLKELEKPVPKDDEILIRVQAAEATKSDVEMRSFRFAVKWFWLPLRIAFGVRKPKRQILGGYFSGDVESLGKDVTQFSTGDQIFGAAALRLGAYGEYVALPCRRRGRLCNAASAIAASSVDGAARYCRTAFFAACSCALSASSPINASATSGRITI